LKPIKPDKKKNIAVGIILAMFCSVCLVFLAEFMDDSLKTSSDIERNLGVPVLTTVTRKEFKACT